MDKEEEELYKMLESKFTGKEMLRLAELIGVGYEKYHQEKLNNNIALGDVSKLYEYKFKAMPSCGGYVTDIIEADSREEAKKILNKQYNEICWISKRI